MKAYQWAKALKLLDPKYVILNSHLIHYYRWSRLQRLYTLCREKN